MAISALLACGGGGGSGSGGGGASPTAAITGTAATGAPMANAPVYIKDARGLEPSG